MRCVLCGDTLEEGNGDNWDDLCPSCADQVSEIMDDNVSVDRSEAIEQAKRRQSKRECESGGDGYSPMIAAGDQIPSTLGEMTLNADPNLPRQKAEKGLALVKEAILDYLGAYADGLRNVDLAHDLGLGSDQEGHQRNYLTYSILGLLLKEAKVLKHKRGAKTYYTRA